MSIYKPKHWGVTTPQVTRHATAEETGSLQRKGLIGAEDFVVGFDGSLLRFVIRNPEGVFYFVTLEESTDQRQEPHHWCMNWGLFFVGILGFATGVLLVMSGCI